MSLISSSKNRYDQNEDMEKLDPRRSCAPPEDEEEEEDDDDNSSFSSSPRSVRTKSSTIATSLSQSHEDFSVDDDDQVEDENPRQPGREAWSSRSHNQGGPQQGQGYLRADAMRVVHILAPCQGTVVSTSPRQQQGEEGREQDYKDGGSERRAGVGARSSRCASSSAPPVSEVRIPLAAVVRQGLIELSREDWRNLYLSTSRSLEKAQLYARTTCEENRRLKRQLIEMQKCLFETRRNKRQFLQSVPEHMYPWSIPDSRRHHNQHHPSLHPRPSCPPPPPHPMAYASPFPSEYHHELYPHQRRAMTAGAPLVVTSTNSEEDSTNEAGSSGGGGDASSTALREQQPLPPCSRREELRHLHYRHQPYRSSRLNGSGLVVHAGDGSRSCKVRRQDGPPLAALGTAAAPDLGSLPAAT